MVEAHDLAFGDSVRVGEDRVHCLAGLGVHAFVVANGDDLIAAGDVVRNRGFEIGPKDLVAVLHAG